MWSVWSVLSPLTTRFTLLTEPVCGTNVKADQQETQWHHKNSPLLLLLDTQHRQEPPLDGEIFFCWGRRVFRTSESEGSSWNEPTWMRRQAFDEQPQTRCLPLFLLIVGKSRIFLGVAVSYEVRQSQAFSPLEIRRSSFTLFTAQRKLLFSKEAVVTVG